MLSGGARRLVALYGVSPGTRAVVASVDDRGLEAALALAEAGVTIAAVADLRGEVGSAAAERLRAIGVEPIAGATVVEARGRKRVRQAVISARGAGGEALGPDRVESCDLLVVSGGSAPATGMIAQAGGRTAYDPVRGHFALSELPETVLAAGEVAGHATEEAAEVSGAVAGLEAALALGDADDAARERLERERSALAALDPVGGPTAIAEPVTERRGKCFACLCEDVTAKDIQPQRRGGLRLDRALEALHDDHHGPLPGPHVPALLGAPDGARDRLGPRARSGPPRRDRRGPRSRSAPSPGGRSSPRSAPPSTPATATWERP